MAAVYHRAAVVLVHYSWRDMNGQLQSKPRPCVIKELLSGQKYLVTKITTVNKATDLILVKAGSTNAIEMGLLLDSYISRNETQIITEVEIIRKIGVCPPTLFAEL